MLALEDMKCPIGQIFWTLLPVAILPVHNPEKLYKVCRQITVLRKCAEQMS